MNILNRYLDFKKNNLYNYTISMSPKLKTKYGKNLVKDYIDTYIKTYYFHYLQTLEKDEVEVYNDETILKEYNGKRLEMQYELNKIIYSPDDYELIDIAYVLTFCSVMIERLNDQELTLENLKKILVPKLTHLKLEYNDELFEQLQKDLISNHKKETKFLTKMEINSFNLLFTSYKTQNNKYLVRLEQNIKQLNKRYGRPSIEKNFNNIIIADSKLETLLYLLNIEILNKIRNSEELDYYFVEVKGIVLDNKDRTLQLFKIMDIPLVKEHVVFVIEQNDYTGHKHLLNTLDKEYSFAISVDLTRVREIDAKLESLEAIDMFDYIIIDKFKNKDYNVIMKYNPKTEKPIFINEVVEE